MDILGECWFSFWEKRTLQCTISCFEGGSELKPSWLILFNIWWVDIFMPNFNETAINKLQSVPNFFQITFQNIHFTKNGTLTPYNHQTFLSMFWNSLTASQLISCKFDENPGVDSLTKLMLRWAYLSSKMVAIREGLKY